MIDIGEVAYILRIKISKDRSKRLLSLSQETYINNILEQFQMKDCKPIYTPMAKNDILTKDMCPKTPEQIERMRNVPYANAVGSLMYAMLCETRYLLCC